VELLNEIAQLRQILLVVTDQKKKDEIQKQIQEKKVEFSLMMERQKRQRK